MALTKISVRGAREHNLKGVDIDLPRDSLIVITGLSGSGKSSLAFDTIYAEGQRRYVESLSAYARQFLEMMQKPDVEHIDGLSPAISIEQKTTSRNPRSTVATVTEIYDYMRLLWARVGVPYSPTTGLPIEAQTVSNMVDRVMALPDGTRLYLLAPVVRGRKGEYRKELAEWQKAGFTRVRIDGEMYGIEEAPALDKKFKHDIEVVVDRLAVKEGIETRLADSFEQALKLADGLAYVDLADGVVPGREDEGEAGGAMKGAGLPANRIVFSERFSCPVSGFTIEEVEPRLFSFNAPQGACPTCDGIGEKQLFDPQLVVPNEALSLKKGAVVPWAKSNPPSPYYMQVLASLAKEYGFDLTTPWQDLGAENQDVILYGTKGKRVPLTFKDGRKQYTVNKPFEGTSKKALRRAAARKAKENPDSQQLAIQTPGKGVSVHTIDCEALESFQETPERWVDLAWDLGQTAETSHIGRLTVIVANKRGTLAHLASVVAENLGNINNLKITDRSKDFFEFSPDIEVEDSKHLNEIIAALRAVSSVSSVERALH